MKTFDWIVVGSGIAGAALSYELVKQGFSVLLLEQNVIPNNATRYSYGGLAYWSGTTDVSRQLCAEGRERYRTLSEELETDIQLRELDLLLTIPPSDDPGTVAAAYAHFATPPQLLSVDAAFAMEPMLNPGAIAGALTVRHGHIHPGVTAQGYCQSFTRRGGTIAIQQVTGLLQRHNRVTGVTTSAGTYAANQVVVCVGGLSRSLLKQAGIAVKVHFTHTELIETPPVELNLQTCIMPADTKRFSLEAESTQPEFETLWDELGQVPVPPILDSGVFQFCDGSLRIGQISRILTDPYEQVEPTPSEVEIRAGIGQILPALKEVPGTWHHCLVAFSGDRLPVVGSIPGMQGLQVFSGFSNPLVIIPPVAARFAKMGSEPDEIIAQFTPSRFNA